jgi:hypothetical protein
VGGKEGKVMGGFGLEQRKLVGEERIKLGFCEDVEGLLEDGCEIGHFHYIRG